MNERELQEIEQRLMEGYYEADADALAAMRRLIGEVRHFRDECAEASYEEADLGVED